MSFSVEFDTSQFDSLFGQIVERDIPDRIVAGLAEACEHLMYDTISAMPTAPLDITTPGSDAELRGSGSVFVNNKLYAVSQVGSNQFVLSEYQEPLNRDEYVGTVIFNAPYAAKWHERLPVSGSFKNPGSGIKYLEIKLTGQAEKYIEIVAYHVAKEV